MQAYHDQLKYILQHGVDSTDRTGVGTKRVFGMQARYDLNKGFPLVTTKRVYWKAVVGELLWFLEGSTNRNRLEEITFGTTGKRATIWDEWADEEGELGPIYGAQWRAWNGDHLCVDQIDKLVKQIQASSDSRRLIVSAWNPGEIDEMALPPCHVLWQVVTLGGKMHLHLYQRSADMFLGVPFNIASYALLLEMLAHVTGYQPGEFVHSIGDAHIYSNHIGAVEEQLSREHRDPPAVILNPAKTSIFDFKMNDVELIGYDPHPTIKAEVAV